MQLDIFILYQFRLFNILSPTVRLWNMAAKGREFNPHLLHYLCELFLLAQFNSKMQTGLQDILRWILSSLPIETSPIGTLVHTRVTSARVGGEPDLTSHWLIWNPLMTNTRHRLTARTSGAYRLSARHTATISAFRTPADHGTRGVVRKSASGKDLQ